MTKVLFYGETPVIETGAARVNRYLLESIVEIGIEVDVLAMSHFVGDDYDREKYPYTITAVQTHESAKEYITAHSADYDVLFISADMHVPIILSDCLRLLPSVVLAAIDGVVRHKDQVKALEIAQWPAVYSEYSRGQVLGVLPDIRDRFYCIQLGSEPETFYPLSEEERRDYRKKAYGLGDDTFLVMSCNRNQMRKDLARGMKAFHLFHDRVPNSLLYMHAKVQDVGGNLVTQAFLSGLQVHGANPEVIFTIPEYNEIGGFTREVLNRMYNAADVCISTAQGEGWGLTTTEAMCAGTPFIGPRNTTFTEILGEQEERGYLVRSGGNNLWSIYYGTDDAPRPLTSVVGMADALRHVYYNPDEARVKAMDARKWCQGHTWADFKEGWKSILWHVRSFSESQDKTAHT